MNNKLISCPVCLQNGQKSILGSVDGLGNFIVQRFYKLTTHGANRSQTTIVYHSEITIVCQCGFGTTISHFAGGKTYPLAS
jgi:hypothetical protein